MLSGFDIAALALLLVAASVGIVVGIFRVALSMVALIAAFTIGLALRGTVAGLLAAVIPTVEVRLLVAFTLTFVVVLALFALLSWLLRKSIQKLGLGWMDRSLGALVAAAVAVALLGGVAIGLERVAPGTPVVQSSLLLSPLSRVVRYLWTLAPASIESRGAEIGARLAGELRPTSPTSPGSPAPPPAEAPPGTAAPPLASPSRSGGNPR